ncbi:putative ubiquitin-conjugating enzyme E2 18 [Nymphaea thermarum]|nr:putative ubiquitin-conjugating enzyme E2 18 [Nymphaea thermarum]
MSCSTSRKVLPAMSCSTSRKSLSTVACLRIQKELMEWEASPPPGFKHKVSDDLQRYVSSLRFSPKFLCFPISWRNTFRRSLGNQVLLAAATWKQ